MSTQSPTPVMLLHAHAKAHKLSPGQQVNLLIYYLSLQPMFPEISLELFLERSQLVAGATKENLQFPKDALDHYCPNKDSAWEPKHRIGIMTLYLTYRSFALADGEAVMPFHEFLAAEAAGFREQYDTLAPANPPVAPAATEAPAAPAPKATKPKAAKKDKAASAFVPVVDARAIFRGPLGDGIGPEITGTIKAVDNERQVVEFAGDNGESLSAIPFSQLFAPTPQMPEAPVIEPAVTHPLRVNKADSARIAGFLALTQPVGNVPLGDILQGFEVDFDGVGKAAIQVINAQPKPSIDAFLVDAAGTALAELPPRENALAGNYDFQVRGQVYRVAVTTHP